jgi:hypothetical protein
MLGAGGLACIRSWEQLQLWLTRRCPVERAEPVTL